MHPELERSLRDLGSGVLTLTAHREAALGRIATWMKEQRAHLQPVHLVFICTHNSRRSQFAQAWAAAAAQHVGLTNVHTWSAGTEATAVAPPVISALEWSGFRLETEDDGNGKWVLTCADEAEPIVLYSKTISDPENPSDAFAAIMVCSDAEQNCPFVPGASARFSLPYADPKVSDGTPDEQRTYLERSEQIASEMLHVMQLANA
ncbi:MAG: protein-tyrosine-phosphatase [Flavobacteriales bacterium]|nr:protein-tyrosine-phosphatase [Flavobacteriales bacterium]